ncbi:tRNA lysidine(34) synthetase TilS [Schaalia sp. lx-100]|uniref:tRNA lysidine(34) synthetase TilS n=1 Tax=Schaalia sp. lx-100 TaxID=2899081 RepID=UPI001E489BC4|nr:tRNA lysidine(34) synthetase TilS [Schaalia sp. lx-100]MCD4557663.1 tRNA lysidine(34) synthetase TilS [Schaalia sp. lx-100]
MRNLICGGDVWVEQHARPLSQAVTLIGPQPRGAVREISLAVRPYIQQMKKEGAKAVLVGFSGGADSTALTVATLDAGMRAGLHVHTLTVDHGVRAESSAEAERVCEQARQLGAYAHICHINMAQEGGPEAAARQGRRAALIDYAARIHEQEGGSCVPIFLGHTLDDQAETVILRLARGSGTGSLRAMDACRYGKDGVWVRPFLGVRREIIREAVKTLGIPWVEDPSNFPDGPWKTRDGSPLRRAAVRADVLPLLNRALGQDVTQALARTAANAADDDDALTQWAWHEYRNALREVRHIGQEDFEHMPHISHMSDLQHDAHSHSGNCERPALTPHNFSTQPLESAPETHMPEWDKSGDPSPNTDQPECDCAVQEISDKTYATGLNLSKNNTYILSVSAVKNLPYAVLARVVRLFLLEGGARAGQLSSTHIRQAVDLVKQWHGQGPLHLPGVVIDRYGKGKKAYLKCGESPVNDLCHASRHGNVAR